MASTPYTNKDFSDSRLKTNFAAISTPIDKVLALQGLTYNGLIPAGSGIEIDTTTPHGKLIFGIFAALAEFIPPTRTTEAARAATLVVAIRRRAVIFITDICPPYEYVSSRGREMS